LQSFAIAIALDEVHNGATPSAIEQLERALEDMRKTGSLDSFVCAYRGYPRLLRYLDPSRHADAARVVIENDVSLAKKAGLTTAQPAATARRGLTRREKEVLALMKRGLSNRAISQALWISESTAKVHVRRVLSKLGAKSRAEAAALAEEGLDGDD
jgi:DNA-binding NarL/FixJ family response regulator